MSSNRELSPLPFQLLMNKKIFNCFNNYDKVDEDSSGAYSDQWKTNNDPNQNLLEKKNNEQISSQFQNHHISNFHQNSKYQETRHLQNNLIQNDLYEINEYQQIIPSIQQKETQLNGIQFYKLNLDSEIISQNNEKRFDIYSLSSDYQDNQNHHLNVHENLDNICNLDQDQDYDQDESIKQILYPECYQDKIQIICQSEKQQQAQSTELTQQQQQQIFGSNITPNQNHTPISKFQKKKVKEQLKNENYMKQSIFQENKEQLQQQKKSNREYDNRKKLVKKRTQAITAEENIECRKYKKEHGQEDYSKHDDRCEDDNQNGFQNNEQLKKEQKIRESKKSRYPIKKNYNQIKQEKYGQYNERWQSIEQNFRDKYNKEENKQMDKTQQIHKPKKLIKRCVSIELEDNKNQGPGYEDQIKDYIKDQKNQFINFITQPEEVSIKTLQEITENISKIMEEIDQKIQQKIHDTQYEQEGSYIKQITMLIVKNIYYTMFGSKPNNYKLKDIKWINRMNVDLQNGFKTQQVQIALEYIYGFILKDENGHEGDLKIEWKKLCTQQNFLKYQLEFGKNFFKALAVNYRKYVDKKIKKNSAFNFDQDWYKLGGLNKQIPDKVFFQEGRDMSKHKKFVVKHFMNYFLENHENDQFKLVEIYLDDVINLIIRAF